MLNFSYINTHNIEHVFIIIKMLIFMFKFILEYKMACSKQNSL